MQSPFTYSELHEISSASGCSVKEEHHSLHYGSQCVVFYFLM